MEITSNTSAASQSEFQAEGTSDPYSDLGFEEFIDLLVAELTNQDPMEPMSNSELMNQIGQIREIASTDQLTNTLDAVMMGQTLATAGNVVNKVVDGMTDLGDRLCGTVVSVAIEEGEAYLQVEDADGEIHSVNMNNVSNIYAEGTSLPTPGYLEFLGESGNSETTVESDASETESGSTTGETGSESEVTNDQSEENEANNESNVSEQSDTTSGEESGSETSDDGTS